MRQGIFVYESEKETQAIKMQPVEERDLREQLKQSQTILQQSETKDGDMQVERVKLSLYIFEPCKMGKKFPVTKKTTIFSSLQATHI